MSSARAQSTTPKQILADMEDGVKDCDQQPRGGGRLRQFGAGVRCKVWGVRRRSQLVERGEVRRGETGWVKECGFTIQYRGVEQAKQRAPNDNWCSKVKGAGGEEDCTPLDDWFRGGPPGEVKAVDRAEENQPDLAG